MSVVRILVVDGNRAETRQAQQAAGGTPSGEGYADVLQSLHGGIACDIVRPADEPVHLPAGRSLDSYAGVAVTGSALNIYDAGTRIERQIELARAVFAAGVPFFGSCWGLQLAVTAAGGVVQSNPLGREFGFGRRIALTVEGRAHAMFAGKPDVFEAITVHRDAIARLPPDSIELACNEMGLQAAQIRHGRGVFWGVQYHPEYSFNEIGATALRYQQTLIGEGLFADSKGLADYVGELQTLHVNPQDRRLAWRHGLGPAMIDPAIKLAEISNWLREQVLPRT